MSDYSEFVPLLRSCKASQAVCLIRRQDRFSPTGEPISDMDALFASSQRERTAMLPERSEGLQRRGEGEIFHPEPTEWTPRERTRCLKPPLAACRSRSLLKIRQFQKHHRGYRQIVCINGVPCSVCEQLRPALVQPDHHMGIEEHHGCHSPVQSRCMMSLGSPFTMERRISLSNLDGGGSGTIRRIRPFGFPENVEVPGRYHRTRSRTPAAGTVPV